MMNRPSARYAYVEAEVVTGLAHQIRALRLQRGWTQQELATRLESTQAAVSRFEDPSYGRYSLATLLQLSRVFDTGLQVRFMSMVHMLSETWRPKANAALVPSFEEEAPTVGFVGRNAVLPAQSNTVVVEATTGTSAVMGSHLVSQTQGALIRLYTPPSVQVAKQIQQPSPLHHE